MPIKDRYALLKPLILNRTFVVSLDEQCFRCTFTNGCYTCPAVNACHRIFGGSIEENFNLFNYCLELDEFPELFI